MDVTLRPMLMLMTAVALVATLTVAFTHPVRAAAAVQSPGASQRMVSDGVYSEAQSRRGQTIYAEACASCHSADLTGGATPAGDVPALAGDEFMAGWGGMTVADLFERVRTSMPPGGPGALAPQQYADVLAYIFSRNNLPAGQADLAADAAGLKTIRFAGAAAAPVDAGPPPDRSVLDGVYLEDQLKRGASVYAESCANCHAAALTGGDVVPALVGKDFLGRWTGATAGELFERMRATMPQDSPGKLSPQAYADILAYIFNKNRFPAGRTELSGEPGVLRMIRIETSKPR